MQVTTIFLSQVEWTSGFRHSKQNLMKGLNKKMYFAFQNTKYPSQEGYEGICCTAAGMGILPELEGQGV